MEEEFRELVRKELAAYHAEQKEEKRIKKEEFQKEEVKATGHILIFGTFVIALITSCLQSWMTSEGFILTYLLWFLPLYILGVGTTLCLLYHKTMKITTIQNLLLIPSFLMIVSVVAPIVAISI